MMMGGFTLGAGINKLKIDRIVVSLVRLFDKLERHWQALKVLNLAGDSPSRFLICVMVGDLVPNAIESKAGIEFCAVAFSE